MVGPADPTSVTSTEDAALASFAGITPEEQTTFDSLGSVPGSTLGDVMNSSSGQAVMSAIQQAIILQMVTENKRQSDHLIQDMEQQRADSQQ